MASLVKGKSTILPGNVYNKAYFQVRLLWGPKGQCSGPTGES